MNKSSKDSSMAVFESCSHTVPLGDNLICDHYQVASTTQYQTVDFFFILLSQSQSLINKKVFSIAY